MDETTKREPRPRDDRRNHILFAGGDFPRLFPLDDVGAWRLVHGVFRHAGGLGELAGSALAASFALHVVRGLRGIHDRNHRQQVVQASCVGLFQPAVAAVRAGLRPVFDFVFRLVPFGDFVLRVFPALGLPRGKTGVPYIVT